MAYLAPMRVVLFIILLCALTILSPSRNNAVAAYTHPASDTIPALCLGNFTDDYGIRYSISDSVWFQLPDVRYHILRWNSKEQYLIARNDDNNPSEKGLFTRIDYMQFKNMEPFHWGFCLTVYDAPNDSVALVKARADRENPRKGCNGYPFSRMKRVH